MGRALSTTSSKKRTLQTKSTLLSEQITLWEGGEAGRHLMRVRTNKEDTRVSTLNPFFVPGQEGGRDVLRILGRNQIRGEVLGRAKSLVDVSSLTVLGKNFLDILWHAARFFET